MFAEYMPPEMREDPAIQDPHRLAWCDGDRRRIWCQHHNGFFRSDDGGETWASLEVPPSSFGFAVAAHPHDPQVAWSVPLVKDECRVPVDRRMVVARTRDGGASWDSVGRGLPEGDSFAVVYRHGLDIHPGEAGTGHGDHHRSALGFRGSWRFVGSGNRGTRPRLLRAVRPVVVAPIPE